MEEILWIAEGLQRRAHAGDVAVMVGAPHVDRADKAALMLVAMIGDVGNEVRVGPVALFQHPVLIIAELGRPQPERAVGGEGVALFVELRECRLDQLALVHR